jgi:hypothetical protein
MDQPTKQFTLEQAHSLGLNSASKMMQADSTAAKTKRQVLIAAAKKVAADEQLTKKFLEGFAEAYANAGATDATVRNRKSNAKNVIAAVAATLVSGENLKKLEEFDGHYNDFIALAAELKQGNTGKQNKGQGERTRKPAEKITANQQDQAETLLEKASAQQTGELVVHAVQTLAKKASPVIAGFQSFLAIQAICSQMLKMDLEPVFMDAVKKIDADVQKVIKQAREAAETADKAGQSHMVETVKEKQVANL